MSEERIQEIKDSINFQYELIVSKGIDKSALLFTDEEQELLEEVERLTKQNKALNEMYELTKKEYIRLNNIINELEKELNKDFNTYMTGNRQNGKVYKAGADNYRMHIYLKLQELKGSDNNENN